MLIKSGANLNNYQRTEIKLSNIFLTLSKTARYFLAIESNNHKKSWHTKVHQLSNISLQLNYFTSIVTRRL